MIRIRNRWAAPLAVDFGRPLGRVRLARAQETELDVDLEELNLPRATRRLLEKGTIEIESLEPPSGGEGEEGDEPDPDDDKGEGDEPDPDDEEGDEPAAEEKPAPKGRAKAKK